MAFILWYIVWKLNEERQLGLRIYEELVFLMQQQNVFWLLIPAGMVFLNWSLEAVKWQMLAQKIEKLSFRNALAGVLVGQSLAFITPQSLGDYAGRIWNIKNRQRAEAIGAVLLGRWAQSMVTGMFGSLGLMFVLSRELTLSRSAVIIIAASILLFWFLLILALVNKRPGFILFLEKILGTKWVKYIEIIKAYRAAEILKIMAVTCARYLIFSLQFFIILKIFDFELNPLISIAGITWMFLMKSVLPAINIFTDLGVREMAVVYFFGYYQVDIAVIIVASVLLWILNILLPTFIGLFYVYRLKITND